jgi:predicted HTH transcriptional regulator
MPVVIILFVVVSLLLIAAYQAGRRQGASLRQDLPSICTTALDRSLRKASNKQKILEYLSQNQQATNAELRQLTGVSNRTVVIYMRELEQDGAVERVGQTGRAVHYRAAQ